MPSSTALLTAKRAARNIGDLVFAYGLILCGMWLIGQASLIGG